MTNTSHIAKPDNLARRPAAHGVETWPGAGACPSCGGPMRVVRRWELTVRKGKDPRTEKREHRRCDVCRRESWGERL